MRSESAQPVQLNTYVPGFLVVNGYTEFLCGSWTTKRFFDGGNNDPWTARSPVFTIDSALPRASFTHDGVSRPAEIDTVVAGAAFAGVHVAPRAGDDGAGVDGRGLWALDVHPVTARATAAAAAAQRRKLTAGGYPRGA
jgi:hypothetical protein